MVGNTMTLDSRKAQSSSKIFSDSGTVTGIIGSTTITRTTISDRTQNQSTGTGPLESSCSPPNASATYASLSGVSGTEMDTLDNSATPNTYVTYTTTGEAGSGTVNGDSGSVVSVDLSLATGPPIAATTTTIQTQSPDGHGHGHGQTISYAYAIGESGIYGSTHGSQLFATSTSSGSSGGLTYAQENGVTYLVQAPTTTNHTHESGQSQNNSSSLNLDSELHLTSPVTRVSPVTVQWLLDNFETAEGVSLPRYTLYHHYIRHCVEHKLDPVNAASFGKLIRSVFLGLRTRRLGTRGNSKYHYYGIRLKPDSPLVDVDVSQIDDQIFGSTASGGGNGRTKNNGHGHSWASGAGGGPSAAKRYKSSRINFESGDLSSVVSAVDSITIAHYLGDSSNVMESLPQLKIDFPIPDSMGLTISADDIKIFGILYLEHCGHLLSDVMHFQLVDFQRRWRGFWRSVGENGNPLHVLEQNQYEARLPKEKLQLICTIKEIQDYVQHTDFEFYQCLTNILLPEVLRPIPGPMTTTIRNFAKAVENCLGSAMSGYSEDILNVKLNVLGSFSQTLRRYTSLNHLAQAARAVLQNEAQINQMISDLNRVDFHPLEDQARWISGCPGDLFSELEEEFKSTLSQHQGLEEWAVWLERAVDRVLRPYGNTTRYSIVARQFLMSWSLYSSLVIRDLTLRSAASFGSFHLLRLLYDEYLFFIVEHRVAKFMGVTPISLLGRKTLNPAFYEPQEGPEADGDDGGDGEEEDENSAPDSS